MVDRNIRRFEQFQDRIARLYPELISKEYTESGQIKTLSRTVTFQVCNDCNLNCKYCYQINKGHSSMSFDTAKKFVDLLLSGEKGFKEYVDPSFSPAIILEFIGGEPFLEIDLIDQVCDYFMRECIRLDHPWATMHMISICSNGILYSDPRVQRFLMKHRDHLSFSITIDGNKELHDSCRVFHDGSPSYDIAIAGAMDWMSKGNYMGSKITIAPGNITYLYDAIIHMIGLGYEDINANCVYEKGWEKEHATELYFQMKRVADYLLENNLENKLFVSLFSDTLFKPKDSKELQTWCWTAGTPILTTQGYKPIEEIKVGDLVYTEDGSIQPVIKTMSHFADNVVEISASGAFKMGCTNNHKLYAMPLDYIGFNYKKHYKEYGKYQIKDLKNRDLIKLFQLPEGQVYYDKNLAYLIGRYIGDGWDSKGNFTICCAYDETEELENAFHATSVDYYRTNNKTVVQYGIKRTNNSNNQKLILALSTCGHLAHNKCLPPECFNWTHDSLHALLNGYMDADGSIKKDGKRIFNTVSYKLAQELMVVLRTLGYAPTCYKNNRAGESKILGRTVHIRDRYEVYYFPEISKSRYIKNVFGGLWTSNLHTKPIEPQQVYNITVANNHSYVAGGIVSSNCGGLGSMLSCAPNGFLYPCIRYMESSLGNDAPPLRIGSVDEGIAQQKCYCDNLKCVTCVNRRTYNTDECFWCPIADGCADCAAYNYQVHGTPNKRAIFICEMHKARALANAYYWSKYNEKYRPEEKYNLYVSEEWALNIIPENEWNSILSMPNIEYKGYINWQEVKRLNEESKGDLYGEEKEN